MNRRNRIAVIGYPISHSLSPAMQEAALKFTGLDKEYSYESIEITPGELPAFIERIRAGEIFGANVTIPHKKAVIPYLDSVDENARLIGAVNTIYREDGRAIGANTDAPGFISALNAEGVRAEGKKAVIIGAGGAARAVGFALALSGAKEIIVANRDYGAAIGLARDLREKCSVESDSIPFEGIPEAVRSASLLVNCTPLGMRGPYETMTPVERDNLMPGLTVVDLVYNPMRTRLIEEAAAEGCKAVTGVGMLVRQGAESFRIWTGVEAPLDVMRAAVMEALK